MYSPNNRIFLKTFLILIGILIGITAITVRTVIDSNDLEKIVQKYTPTIFNNEKNFKNVYNTIIARPIYLNPDGFYWIVYATELVKQNKFRLRSNEFDNTPFGREIGWSSGYLWYLVLLGKIDSVFTGRALISSIEHAGQWANPLLVSIFGIFWGIVLGINFNPFVGGLFPLIFFFCGATQPEMTYGFGDHHALQFSLAMSQLLAIILGGSGFIQNNKIEQTHSLLKPFQPNDYNTSRNWFITAGLFGAAGLWVGATQQSLIIALIGFGGCLAALICGPKKKNYPNGSGIVLVPHLWRYWGWAGSVFTCFFYFIEFFPNHFGMRLEIIHPLYALSWLGGSEILYRICCLTIEKQKYEFETWHYLILFLSLISFCLLPFAILLGPKSWHIIHDPITVRWHDNIYEYMSLYDSRVGKISFDFIFDRFGLYSLSIIPTILAFIYLIFDRFQRVIIIQSWVPTVILLSLYVYEVRWGLILSTFLIILTVTLFSGTIELAQRAYNITVQKVITFIFLLLLVPHWTIILKENYFTKDPSQGLYKRFFTLSAILLARELSINYKIISPEKKIRLIGAGDLAPIFAYYGVAQSVGSPYWENFEGIKDETKFYSAYSEYEALEIVKKRNINHVLFEKNDFKMASEALWTYRGSNDINDLKKTFAYRVISKTLSPPWLEPDPMLPLYFIKKYNILSYKISLE